MSAAATVRPLLSDHTGEIRPCPPGWEAVGQSGHRFQRAQDWIPLPRGSVLMHLPQRGAVASSRKRGEVALVGQERFWAVAAVLPVGYLRLLLPAHRRLDRAVPTLPLYGYTAAGELDGEVVVAARATDDFAPWTGTRASRAQLELAVEGLQRQLPRSRVVAQLSVCALSHGCLTAQNTFLGRGEGALPTSAACNADCLGCISLQSDSGAPTPQPRIARAPSAQELIEVGEQHLAAATAAGERGMVSFGQGCEGEPLLRERALIPVIRRLRGSFPRATIHINTNGSRPAALGRLIAAGVNSCRISVFSFEQQLFAAYYRPRGYSIGEVASSARLARSLGAQLTINLLTFPGITDLPEEAARTTQSLRELEVDQLQLRTLNVDPLWLLERVPTEALHPALGMVEMLARLGRELPQLRLGNFTRPVEAQLPVFG